MRVLVTGATGFVGRHVVTELVARGHVVRAVARDAERLGSMPWSAEVELISCDAFAAGESRMFADRPDAMVHLAWPGLPNYLDQFHMDTNLPADLALLARARDGGVKQVMVAGTCLEYGLQDGALEEDGETRPTTPYGVAKDRLRSHLMEWRQPGEFAVKWMRLFYMHGPGQSPRSVLAQLDAAIDRGDPSFDMSPGDQLRDYLHVHEVASDLADALESQDLDGVFNVCSGKPISILELVRRRCAERGRFPAINTGVFPYPMYEPFAFWGLPRKLEPLREARRQQPGGR